MLRGVEQLNTTDLEDFIRQILQIKAKRKAVKTQKKEAELLLVINHNFNKTEQVSGCCNIHRPVRNQDQVQS